MRSRGPVILFIIAVALLGYWFVVERPRSQREDRAATEAATLCAIDPVDVDRVWIERNGQRLVFSITGTHWRIDEPVEDVAEQASVNRLIQEICNGEVERNLGPQDDLSPYGLDKPDVVIALGSAAGDTLGVFFVGDANLDRSFVYIRRDHEPDVLLGPTGVRRYAAIPLAEFRNDRVVNFDLSVVRAYEITSPSGSVSWERDDAGDWFSVVNGDTISGDKTAVESPLRRLRGLRVSAFPSPEQFSAQLAASGYRVTIEKEPPAPPLILEADFSGGSALAQVSGETRVVETDSSLAIVFTGTVESMRQRRLLRFSDSVARIVVESADTSATLVRAGGEWARPNPALGRLDASSVAAFLAVARNLSFGRVLEEGVGMNVLSPPYLFHLVVYDDGGTLLDEVACRRDDAGRLVATSRSSRVLAEVAPADLETVTGALRRIRNAR